MFSAYRTLLFAFLCFGFPLSFDSLQCRDQNNEAVDWYVVYKLPKDRQAENKLIKEGVAYMYMTSANYSQWVLSDNAINSTSSNMVAYTLNGLFNKQQNNLFILYNDQPPYGSTNENKGHTKGVVMGDQNGGFWLIHSVPHFPHSLVEYDYPSTGVHYGQSFLCITMDLKNLNRVGVQLQYNEPHIYAQNVPAPIAESVPELSRAAQNETVRSSPWNNMENITSQNGFQFVSFAKSGRFGKDLYFDWLMPVLDRNLYVETWPNEPNRLPSICTKRLDRWYEVENVSGFYVNSTGLSFRSTEDHSKWAVSIPSLPSDKTSWICIGDINRAQRQTLRGGGTTCIENNLLASHYQKLVATIEACKVEYRNQQIS